LLADDHKILAQALANYLRDEFELVGIVDNGEQLLAVAGQTHPDVVVADISMPRLSGLEALRQMRAQGLECRVIFLTMHGEPELAAEAMRAGASGYLLKSSAGEELIAAIHEVLDDKVHLSPLIAKAVLNELSNRSGRQARKLTPRQREVLKLLASGLSMKQVAGELGLSPRTVESHKYEMMEVLGIKNTAQLVQYAIHSGLTAG
jgi:DNA-binding NarL/FixJ family response regulator